MASDHKDESPESQMVNNKDIVNHVTIAKNFIRESQVTNFVKVEVFYGPYFFELFYTKPSFQDKACLCFKDHIGIGTKKIQQRGCLLIMDRKI
jgi:hypothetical protein